MNDAAGAYLYQPKEAELRWMGETSRDYGVEFVGPLPDQID